MSCTTRVAVFDVTDVDYLLDAVRRIASQDRMETERVRADNNRLETECAALRDELLMAQSRYGGTPRLEPFGSVGEVAE